MHCSKPLSGAHGRAFPWGFTSRCAVHTLWVPKVICVVNFPAVRGFACREVPAMPLRTRVHISSLIVTLSFTLIAPSSWAKEKILHNFVPYSRGANSMSSLISDASGNPYGTTGNCGHYGFGTVFKLTPISGGGWTETVIHNFTGGALGSRPEAGLVFGAAGELYGTTFGGGYEYGSCDQGGCGTVFELTPGSDGKWSHKILHTFQYVDGSSPRAPLILDTAGNLYGTTYGGPCCGAVFKLTPGAGGKWSQSVLYSFSCGNCGGPSSGVIFDKAGNLYGTLDGFGNGSGGVFQLSPSTGGSWTESVIYNFCSQPHCADGSSPSGGVIFDSAGNLYGVTSGGGTKKGYGVAFELSPGVSGTWTESVIYQFRTRRSGTYPMGGLVFDSAGNLYGTSTSGGRLHLCGGWGCGTVFELTPSSDGTWNETVIHAFSGGHDGVSPGVGLMIDRNGNLYGTTEASGLAPSFNSGGTVFKFSPSSGGWIETVHEFKSTDGANSAGSLIFDGSGKLYGTTVEGGAQGYGTVFELSPISGGGWQRTILYSFKGGVDNGYPLDGLVRDSAGNLYGTTSGVPGQWGTIFELTPATNGAWIEKILYTFNGYPDGAYPYAGLVLDPTGSLYGTTWEGGSSCCGTVFKLTPSSGGGWTEEVIHSFTGGADGGAPAAMLAWDSAGNMYGTTVYGGNDYNNIGAGVVFRLSPDSSGQWTESVLYTFTGGADGSEPAAGVIFDQAGNVYGTTQAGGKGTCAFSRPCGVVFELSPQSSGTWKESVIYDFPDDANTSPVSNLVFDSAGNLYGTASDGTPYNRNYGTVFKLAPRSSGEWKETTLHIFTGGNDGAIPEAGLVLDGAGNLYGTTGRGGSAGGGIVFEITP
jgi:uncharacterized repeat protein (TIGR03803 family)